MGFRPSQWLPFIIANTVAHLRGWVPVIKHWAWYGFRRMLLICATKHSIDTLMQYFQKRKLGVSFARELSLVYWVPPSLHYEWDSNMRMFIRKCGYHYSPAVVGFGKKVEPWFYGEIRNDTRVILEKMEAKALKYEKHDKKSQAEEMQAVIRILRNFSEFNMEEIMVFFKASELVSMEPGQAIFGPDDMEEYFYSVVSGEIHLFCDGFGNRGVELMKVAGPEDCVISILSFLRYFAIGQLKFSDLKLYANCAVAGKYYRVPMLQLLKYIQSDQRKMFEILCAILLRNHKFMIGLNDLTGILPRLHKQSFLDAHYEEIEYEPGLLSGTNVANEAFNNLKSILSVAEDDRRLCWVGVLGSSTVLLQRFKVTKYAFYIHAGLVACTVSKLRRSYNAIQFYLSTGQIVGWREAIVGTEMSIQYQVADGAKALVIAIPSFLVKRYFKKNPEMSIPMITKQLERYSLLTFQLDYAMQFTQKRANEVVYRKTDEDVDENAEAHAYLCLSGRLRFIIETDIFHKRDTVARYGILEKGDWFGMVAMYTDRVKMHRTIICDRCSEHVKVPRYVISAITSAFREAAGYQVDYMARFIHRDHEHTFLDTDKMADSRILVNQFGVNTWRTYRMVCIYPASEEIPTKIYCDELARHSTSSAGVVTWKDAVKEMEVSEFKSENEYSLAKWLVLQEEKYTVLFVVANNNFCDLWNQTVATLCDMIQVLVTYDIPHKPDDNETRILEMATKARKELVFIHPVIRVTKPQVGPSRFPHLPQGSILWLRPRPWVQRHHHVRMLDSALKYMREKNPADLKKYMAETKDPDKHNDYGRVMRWITGQSVGLVLGGGGAKGAAHLGAIHYLTELDVPIDYVAGVSIGSFLGALYAVYENIQVVESKAKELWEGLRSPMTYARDLPFHPFSAGFRGHSFNFMINYFFESIQIEDLYIPYFCVSTDLNDNCSRTHMSGDLWFYVRASMTLTLVFPPQINQFDNHLLMDGGYSDLVPAMTMRRLGIKYLVAINIGDERLISTFNIGYHVSGMKCILQNLLPHSIGSVPNHFSFWDALLYCSARNFIQILKAMDEYCIYIRPNINAYTALDFQNYEEIKTAGYLSTKCKFGGLKLKNLPVHVLWYLLRFYTYPTIAMSQGQLLQGFKDEDWAFAVELMSKTQMFQRARTTFLKMNLTPYLTDVMEARSYLENIINEDEVRNLNLNIPVLENFSRDDERLDLVHAIARMKEWAYMEEFENIIYQGEKGKTDIKIRTKVHVAASQDTDLLNVKGTTEHQQLQDVQAAELQIFGASSIKASFSIKDLFKADPTLFHVVQSYHHLLTRKKQAAAEQNSEDAKSSAVSFHIAHKRSKKSVQSLPSLHSIIAGFKTTGPRMSIGKPAEKGQRLSEFRKYLTKADRRKDSLESKLTPIVTLKQLRRSFAHKGMTQL